MPRNKDIKKVLVIGSGPIVIGQAAEFDYAGMPFLKGRRRGGMSGKLQPCHHHDRQADCRSGIH